MEVKYVIIALLAFALIAPNTVWAIDFNESVNTKLYWDGKGTPTTAERKAEAYRIYQEIKGHPSYQSVDEDGNAITIPEKIGIDLKSATFTQVKNYMQNETIEKSGAIKKFVFKFIALKWPNLFQQIINIYPNLAEKLQKYLDNNEDSTQWLGDSGFHYDPNLE